MDKKETNVTRRQFLRQSVIGAAALGVSKVLPPQRVLGANDRIQIGIIGCGGMGGHHLERLVDMAKKGEENIEVIAVCDIYEPRKEKAKAVSGAKVFHDYRQLLDWKEVDVVWIATPEHWHAKMAIDAMEAGKDIYLEKPMTRYWEEAKQVYQTALRTKRVVQVGSQWTTEEKWRVANKLIKDGKIGKVVWAQTSYSRNSKEGEWNYGIDANCGPHNLDWNAFLGSAPKRPFDPQRFFRWRKYWDYSAGIATDLFPHVLIPLSIAIGADFPKRVTASGGIYVHKDREVPDTFHLIAEYPGEYNIVCLSSMANQVGVETMIRGHEATMYLSGSEIVIRPEHVYAEGREEIRQPVPQPGDHIKEHHKNFLKCVRTREKPFADVELGYKIQVVIGLAERSYREDKVMLFDPQKQEVIT